MDIQKLKIPVTGRDLRLARTLLSMVAVMVVAGRLGAQQRPLGVCEALNSVGDHHAVVIRAALNMSHLEFLFEGTIGDPCPGWPKRFFTAPAAVRVFISSYAGVRVPDSLFRANMDFLVRLKNLQRATRSAPHMMTVSGVLIRKPWLLSFRGKDGTYIGWGEGLYGGFAGVLVVTEPIKER